jgi:hypothetical protein
MFTSSGVAVISRTLKVPFFGSAFILEGKIITLFMGVREEENLKEIFLRKDGKVSN